MGVTHIARTWEFWIWVHFSRKSLFSVSSKQRGWVELIPIAAVALHLKEVQILYSEVWMTQAGADPRQRALTWQEWSYPLSHPQLYPSFPSPGGLCT